MHYYGTYAMARAAGIARDAATIIATAAEYVDDCTDTTAETVHPLGARFEHQRTAHHPTDLAPNNNLHDQMRVWVPFHFIPGAEGKSFHERLICRKDSAIARAMVDHHLALAAKPFALELIGLAAHVYADTFAHYGFSGITSPLNRVDLGSIKIIGDDPLVEGLARSKLAAFLAKFDQHGSLIAELGELADRAVCFSAELATSLHAHGALGHGAVATFPDQPYLTWRYSYKHPELWSSSPHVERRNAVDFSEGCQALHALFSRFVEARPDLADKPAKRTFGAVQETVDAILNVAQNRNQRACVWKKALAAGELTGQRNETVPDYDATLWREAMLRLDRLDTPLDALQVPAYRFHEAAAMHRQYVLRELLPDRGIVLI
jgi:hypothetical protein